MRRALIAIVFLTAGMVVASCDTPCHYRILDRIDSGTSQVGCCGASATQEIVIPEERDLAVDIAQVAIDTRSGGQDVYLTPLGCARLFDGAYPAPGTGARPTPLCDVVAGPVVPGTVSPRAGISPGRYRVFVQAYSANTTTNDYRFEVNVWGSSCGRSPAGP